MDQKDISAQKEVTSMTEQQKKAFTYLETEDASPGLTQSSQHQQTLMDRKADEEGLVVTDSFVTTGVSSSREEAEQRAKDGDFEAVIVWDSEKNEPQVVSASDFLRGSRSDSKESDRKGQQSARNTSSPSTSDASSSERSTKK